MLLKKSQVALHSAIYLEEGYPMTYTIEWLEVLAFEGHTPTIATAAGVQMCSLT